MTNEEFKNLVLSRTDPNQQFRPVAVYNTRDDSLEILISDESYRCDRVDKTFTVYTGRESDQVVGAMIRGVRHLLKTEQRCHPEAIHLEVHEGKVKVVHIFRRIREEFKEKQPAPMVGLNLVIEKLEEAAELNDLEADVGSLTPCGQ